ncbi:MAG: FHA domain-containing protein, partial [Planctomycetota bacterium]
MQALSDPQPDRAASGRPTSSGEVVVLNGRAAVRRQPLTSPLTLIGRAVQCEIRLEAEDIEPLHCALAIGAAGPVLRDLGMGGLTLVNGQPITSCSLQPGDVIAIGPLRLQLHLPAAADTAADTTIREKEALRIQAAAVVAQQAALTEEEIRLQHRQSALVQQEQQLASLLEEKRQRLVTLREEARQAHDALGKERASYEERVAQVQSDLAASRRELSAHERGLQAERRQLFKLRHQLKRRWHRHW